MSNTMKTPVTKENPRGGKPLRKQPTAPMPVGSFEDALEISPVIQKWAEENGYHLSWMRWSVQGMLDRQHLEQISRRGYSPVTTDEIPSTDVTSTVNSFTDRLASRAAAVDNTGIPGVITQKDLILCKIDKELYEERRRQVVNFAEDLRNADRQKLIDSKKALGELDPNNDVEKFEL